VFLAEPASLHACPVHAPMMHGPKAAHGMHHHGSGDRHGAPHGASHACSCPGPCCATALTPLPPHAPQLADIALVVVPRAARPDHEYVAAWTDFVLPFATAPPRSLV
jgi:hypothetical protein